MSWVLVAACGIFHFDMWDLVPWLGIEPRSPALGAQSLSPWTTRESHCDSFECKLMVTQRRNKPSLHAQSLRCARLFATRTAKTAAGQAPLSVGFFRQEHWRGLPFPSPEGHFMLHPDGIVGIMLFLLPIPPFTPPPPENSHPSFKT